MTTTIMKIKQKTPPKPPAWAVPLIACCNLMANLAADHALLIQVNNEVNVINTKLVKNGIK